MLNIYFSIKALISLLFDQATPKELAMYGMLNLGKKRSGTLSSYRFEKVRSYFNLRFNEALDSRSGFSKWCEKNEISCPKNYRLSDFGDVEHLLELLRENKALVLKISGKSHGDGVVFFEKKDGEFTGNLEGETVSIDIFLYRLKKTTKKL